MAPRFAWVLNLDADLELGAGARYRPSKSVRLAMKAPIGRLVGSLLGPQDLLVDESCPVGVGRGLAGRTFCPTPRALAILERAGADPEPHPAIDVLRRVNSRAFASSLGATLPGAAFVTDLEVARTMLCAEPMVGSGWRVKSAFGMAGRNQRVVASSGIDERSLVFVQAGLAQGGLQIEPNVVIETEYAVHGLIAPDGSLRVGSLVRQRCDPRGAWLATEPTSREREGRSDVVDPMAEEARRVAGALFRAGYFGPFGVDAYTYRDREGALRLQPRSEINARYSMGFAIGWGAPGGSTTS
jgi:hypothetical protein